MARKNHPLHNSELTLPNTEQVKELQQSLQDLGYDLGPTGIDGEYYRHDKHGHLTIAGSHTDEATRKFIDDLTEERQTHPQLPELHPNSSFKEVVDAAKAMKNARSQGTLQQKEPAAAQTPEPVAPAAAKPAATPEIAQPPQNSNVTSHPATAEDAALLDSAVEKHNDEKIAGQKLRDDLSNMAMSTLSKYMPKLNAASTTAAAMPSPTKPGLTRSFTFATKPEEKEKNDKKSPLHNEKDKEKDKKDKPKYKADKDKHAHNSDTQKEEKDNSTSSKISTVDKHHVESINHAMGRLIRACHPPEDLVENGKAYNAVHSNEPLSDMAKSAMAYNLGAPNLDHPELIKPTPGVCTGVTNLLKMIPPTDTQPRTR